MGQKTNPIGFRLGVTKNWRSTWYAKKEMPALLKEDALLRKYLKARLENAAISDVRIERKPGKVVVTMHTGRPGVVIGKKGAEVDKLRDELAQLTGQGSRDQRRGDQAPGDRGAAGGRQHRRAAVAAHLVPPRDEACGAERDADGRAGHQGEGGGRLGGAEIARVEGYHEGRVPLHTLRADIDYATSTAKTTYGTIGVKVWIFKGEIVEDRRGKTYSTGA